MHQTMDRKLGGTFGTILVRALVPFWVLLGAAMKWWSATPERLPDWIVHVVNQRVDIQSQYDVLVGLLKSVLAVELLAVVAMLFFGRLARPVALIILGVFACVALMEVGHQTRLSEEPFLVAAFQGDCGCFGTALPFSIPPAVMALLDAVLFGLVYAFRPRTRPLRATPKAGAIGGLLAGALALALAFNPQMKDIHSTEAQFARYQPHHWVGWKFEETGLYEWLSGSVDPATFGGGWQTWILYRETCPTCHRIFLENFSEPELDHVVVAVHVVPAPDEQLAEEPQPVTCPACQFVDLEPGLGRKYSIPTPIIIEIDERGIVTKVENPLLRGQPQQDESGAYRHGTDEIRESWRREVQDE